MWGIYQLSQSLGTRPSELLAIEDAYVAYCLDEAVMVFGTFVTNKLEAVEGKPKEQEKKRKALLGELLKLPDEQRFRPFRRPGGGK